jgi:hypothetical protein
METKLLSSGADGGASGSGRSSAVQATVAILESRLAAAEADAASARQAAQVAAAGALNRARPLGWAAQVLAGPSGVVASLRKSMGSMVVLFFLSGATFGTRSRADF